MQPAEFHQIVFDFANENDVTGFSHDLGTAGQCWFSYLLKRWPKLSVKGATNLLLQHPATSTKESVMLWLLNLQRTWPVGINSPDQIWNIDEHGTEHAVKGKRVVDIKMSNSTRSKLIKSQTGPQWSPYVNAAGYALAP